MTTTSITQGQLKQYKRLIEDAGDRAIAEGNLDKDGLQRLLGNGDQLQADLIASVQRLAAPEPVCGWTEKDGIIYFDVTSDGTTGEDWISRLEGQGKRVGDYAKSVLRSSDFKSTKGVKSRMAVMKGELFSESDRLTRKIRAEAERRKFATPNAEVACLIREKFSDDDIEAMGLWWIVVFHEPIEDSVGGPGLLGAIRDDDGRWLIAFCDYPDNYWDRSDGFAFAVPQVS